MCLTVLFSPLFPAPASVQAAELADQRTETVEEQFDRLQREIDDLRSRHESEMQELREKLGAAEKGRERQGAPHQPAPPGGSGGIMNPDLSAVVDVQALFTDNKTNADRNKVRVKHLELAVQGYLYPGIRADIIPALEMVYEGDEVSVEVDLEEAYLSVFQIPYLSENLPLELQAGRKFMNFGRLNPVHSHHWPFADTPLVLANLFGEHAWFDDGLQGSLKVPNPLDLYLKTTFGFWNGKQLGHTHEGLGHDHHEDAEDEGEEDDHGDHDHAHHEAQPISWDGHVYLSRTVLGIPFSRQADSLVGYSLAWDEGMDTVLHGADLTLTFRFPGTFQRIRWQNEFFAADLGLRDITRYGGYSLLAVDLSRTWQVGYRYDQTQTLDPHESGHEWAASGFLTYYFNHSLYLRGQYRFRRMVDDTGEHNGTLQLVFGLGPHSHRLDD